MNELIWQKIAQGEKGAFTEMYVYFFKKLFNYGKKFTDKDVLIEDAAQEAFVAIWNYRKRLPKIEAPQSYLFLTFRNGLFKRLKEENKRNQKEADQYAEPEFNIELLLIKSEVEEHLKQDLYKVLKELPARQREAVFLRFYEELPYEQIADIMQISLKASYKTVSKGLIYLRDKLNIPIVLIPLLFASSPK